MKTRDRWVAMVIAVFGFTGCMTMLVRFLLVWSSNGLPSPNYPFLRDHYLAVADAYGQAFMVGFFSCFFLVLGLIGIVGRATGARPDPEPARSAED